MIALSAAMTAHLEKNKRLPAIVWNLAVAALASGIAFYLTKILP